MNINKDQAEAIAAAILAPDLKAQDDLQNKKMAGEAKLANQRRTAKFALVGCVLGTVVGYLSSSHIFYFFVAGGLLGAIVSRAYKSPTA